MLVAAVLVGGCQKQVQKADDFPLSSSDAKKAKLFRKIDKKFENPEAHYQLGKLYQVDGLWKKAESEYHITLGYDPVHWRAEAALVKTVLSAGDDARAAPLAKNYINQAGYSAKASLLLGEAFQKELLNGYAFSCYQQGLALEPDSAVFHKKIGYYYLSQRQTARAEDYLRQSFQIDPYQTEVARELGRMGVIVKIPPKKQAKPFQFIDDIWNGIFPKKEKPAEP